MPSAETRQCAHHVSFRLDLLMVKPKRCVLMLLCSYSLCDVHNDIIIDVMNVVRSVSRSLDESYISHMIQMFQIPAGKLRLDINHCILYHDSLG